MNKNRDEYKGDFWVYKISIFGITFKFGKANSETMVKKSGWPTRLHQQMIFLQKALGENNVTSGH